MTWLDALLLIIGANLGFVLGAWWRAQAQQEECMNATVKSNTTEQNNTLKYCYKCKYYIETLDPTEYGVCVLQQDVVIPTDTCLSWQERK